jgi:hypothetical protein
MIRLLLTPDVGPINERWLAPLREP